MHRQQCGRVEQINNRSEINAEQLSKLLAAFGWLETLGDIFNDRDRNENNGTIWEFPCLHQKGGDRYFLANQIKKDGMRTKHGIARTQNGCEWKKRSKKWQKWLHLCLQWLLKLRRRQAKELRSWCGRKEALKGTQRAHRCLKGSH